MKKKKYRLKDIEKLYGEATFIGNNICDEHFYGQKLRFKDLQQMCNYKITFSRVCEASRIDNLFWTASNSYCYFRNVQTYMNVVLWEFLLEFYGQVLISNTIFASWIGYFPTEIYLCQRILVRWYLYWREEKLLVFKQRLLPLCHLRLSLLVVW